MKDKIYEAYSDESGFHAERFQSLSVVSGERCALESLRKELSDILKAHSLSELKWEDVKGHKPKLQCANKFLKIAIKYACEGKVRIDVLLWDVQDSRHAICGRNDIKNLGRMYYKILVHIARRWKCKKWSVFPDINSAINWEGNTRISEYDAT